MHAIDTYIQQSILTRDYPSNTFRELYLKRENLATLVGFAPLRLRIRLREKTLDSGGVLQFERSDPPPKFNISGAQVNTYEVDGEGGHIHHYEPANSIDEADIIAGLPWVSTNLIIIGSMGTVSGTKITLKTEQSMVDLVVWPSATPLVDNFYRLRRKFDTAVAGEVIGAGTGTKRDFTATLANAPICPGSVKINFTDSVGLKTALIRDNGKGRLTTLPPDVLLSRGCTINYTTGEVVLLFAANHAPANATNITIDYEYASVGVDGAIYDIEWEYNG